MKAAQRDAMVKAVQKTHGKWPRFKDLPVAGDVGDDIAHVEIEGDPAENANYVRALYELCARGAVPIGRREKGGTIVGKAPKA